MRYGYKNIKHISSLGGGMIFFLVGSTICILEAWHAFQNPELLTLGATALATMGVSFVTELFSLIYAWKEANRSAKEKNISWLDYVRRGDDPNVSLVFLEDVASVLGVVIATSCMLLASYFQSSYIDALGSVLIGGILAYVSLVIVRSNYHALIGQSIPEHKQEEITSELERDRVIRSVHDVKATQTAGDIRFKAEVDFDGREITLSYLRSIDTEILLKEMQNVKTADDVEKIMLEHGNDIIGQTGLEIDRIEKKLR
ncbi:hypothetical protein KUTeg_023935 [Tegillarca granosa]|uniref:Cation efflux protein transmembrane domain-containing protein n=1 Tax=Tegillarca granosa TaxID=220873 RepID=A0ABQ9E050_TEGGR|nr:hypothetical protein KUTeg_023935 [Tegillarca granosa]